uniref:BEN domain-containing protein n=1 Tax=Anopheles atroparvus TaxID=41427 RepID=A0A182IPE2_ANOAO
MPAAIVPTNEVSSGAGVSMQTNQTLTQSFSDSSNDGNSNSRSDDVSQSNESSMVPTRYYTRQHVSQKPAGHAGLPRAPSWLLIEWERPHGEPYSYAVIASTQIVDQDKKFIETELRQLRKMAANNLNTKLNPQMPPVQRQQNFTALDHHHTGQQMHSPMHRNEPNWAVQFPDWKHCVASQHHVEHQGTVPAKKRLRHDSASSCRDPLSPSPTTVEARSSEQSTVTGHRAGALSAERIITPRSDRTARSNAVQPMTFDQQTQTIGPAFFGATGNDAQLGKVISYLESIMAEQKSCQMEREYDRKLLHDLHEKLMVQERMLRGIEEKIALQRNPNQSNPGNDGADPNSVSADGIGLELSLIDRCLMTDEDGRLLGEYRCNEAEFVENSAPATMAETHLDANSNQSWIPSIDAMAKNVHGAISSTASIDLPSVAVTTATVGAIFTTVESTENYVFPSSDQRTVPGESGGNAGYNNTSCVRPTTTGKVEKIDLIDDLKKDWEDEEAELERSNGDEEKSPSRLAETATSGSANEMVSIGAHGTLVKQSALQKINWSNYKSATRKLLMEVFGREKLATHSLSGRPSPALRGNADKPVKDRLEANMVADVMEMVCKRCNINEALVRNVITAKCADENKMRKQRAGLLTKRVETTKAAPQKVEPDSVTTHETFAHVLLVAKEDLFCAISGSSVAYSCTIIVFSVSPPHSCCFSSSASSRIRLILSPKRMLSPSSTLSRCVVFDVTSTAAAATSATVGPLAVRGEIASVAITTGSSIVCVLSRLSLPGG